MTRPRLQPGQMPTVYPAGEIAMYRSIAGAGTAMVAIAQEVGVMLDNAKISEARGYIKSEYNRMAFDFQGNASKAQSFDELKTLYDEAIGSYQENINNIYQQTTKGLSANAQRNINNWRQEYGSTFDNMFTTRVVNSVKDYAPSLIKSRISEFLNQGDIEAANTYFLENYQFLSSANRSAIMGVIAKAGKDFKVGAVSKLVQDLAQQYQDWDKALAVVSSPKWMKKNGFTSDDIKEGIEAARTLRTEQKAIAKRQQEALISETTRSLWQKAFQNELSVDEVYKRYADGAIENANKNDLIKYVTGDLVPTSNLQARAKVIKALRSKELGLVSEREAETILYKNAKHLTPTDNNNFQERLLKTDDPVRSKNFNIAQRLGEDLIRDKDPMSGFFTDNENQITGTAQLVLELDQEVERAAREGKALSERDILIRSIEIATRIKREIKQREDQPTTENVPAGGIIGVIGGKVEQAIPKERLLKSPDLRIYQDEDLTLSPVGFESIWDRLDDFNKQQVLKKLQQGADAQKLSAYIEDQLGE